MRHGTKLGSVRNARNTCDDGLNNPAIKASKLVWSKNEDEQLRGHVNDMPTKCRISWTTVSGLMVGRSAKQCRDRWFNCLLPNSKRGQWTIQEEKKLMELQSLYGNKWTMIASFLPGRSDYDIRKRWYSISKRLWSKGEDEQLKGFVDDSPEISAEINERWTTISALMVNRSAKECRDRWFSHLRPKVGKWTAQEDEQVMRLQSLHGNNWMTIASFLSGRSDHATRSRYHMIKKNRIHTSDTGITKAARSYLLPASKMMNQETSDTKELHKKDVFSTTQATVKVTNNSSTANLSPHRDSTIMQIQDAEDAEPSEADCAFFAHAVAYATTFINADNT